MSATGTFSAVTVNSGEIGFSSNFGDWPGTTFSGYVIRELVMIDVGGGTSQMRLRIETDDQTGSVPGDLFETMRYTDAAGTAIRLVAADATQTPSTGTMEWLWAAQTQSQWAEDDVETITLTDSTVNTNCACDDTTDYETLGELRARLLVRLGYAGQVNNPPPGMASLLNDFLVSSQRILYTRHVELRTERFFTWTMEVDGRFYDIDDNDDTCSKKLNALRVTWVGVSEQNDDAGAWTPLAAGIPPEFYSGLPLSGRPERYEIRQCIEVFPPPDEAYKLRVKGHYKLQAFTADSDKTTIDSELVFLWALATAKAHYGHPDANNIAAMANTYLGQLTAGRHTTKRYIPRGGPVAPSPRPVMRDGYDA